MEYITSRGFRLPESEKRMGSQVWFNLWQRKLWPYEELVVADVLYWYESLSRCLVWKTRVLDVHRFRYDNKADVTRKLERAFGGFDRHQLYFVRAPSQGFCLAYKISPVKKIRLAKPEDLKFPQKGWLRVDEGVGERWLAQPKILDDVTLDDIVSEGTLLDKLRRLDEVMAGISPRRVNSIVTQTIRRDTRLVKALKQLCEFRCQFPDCGVRILKRNGSFYIEAAHIEPVRSGGQSVLGNLLVLCPNHHKEFDYGRLQIHEQTPEYMRGTLNGRHFEIRLPQLSTTS